MMRKRKPGGGRKQGASSPDKLMLYAIGIALELLFLDRGPAIKGKIARWATALADPSTTSLVEIKGDCLSFQLQAPANMGVERRDNIAKNLRQSLKGTASNSRLTQAQGEFVRLSAEVIYFILSSRSLYVSQMLVPLLEGWPPSVLQHLQELALCLNSNNPGYNSPQAALSDPALRLIGLPRT